jgi:hypothetical protein
MNTNTPTQLENPTNIEVGCLVSWKILEAQDSATDRYIVKEIFHNSRCWSADIQMLNTGMAIPGTMSVVLNFLKRDIPVSGTTYFVHRGENIEFDNAGKIIM